jgi:hypothetical protein
VTPAPAPVQPSPSAPVRPRHLPLTPEHAWRCADPATVRYLLALGRTLVEARRAQVQSRGAG